MTVYVFAGPTLTADDLGPEEILLPPAEQGDVYRAAVRLPAAIALVDGRFHDVPSVWHKEVLWALHRGVPVYGAASMGALRAAELCAFGMRGVGWVFEQYHTGVLEDDDEVAVAHADASDGFRATSEAMVNIRRTLDLAVRQQVISHRTSQCLLHMIKRVHYPLRSYPGLLLLGRQAGLPTDEIDALGDWLPGHRVDQKRLDALALLAAVRADGREPTRRSPSFAFAHTVFFEVLRRGAGDLPVAGPQPGVHPVSTGELLAELRLDPDRYRAVRERVAARYLASQHAGRLGLEPTEEQAQAVSDQFRRTRGLLDVAAVGRWLADNELTMGGYNALLRQEFALHQAGIGAAGAVDVYLRGQLRADGLYRPLVDRIRRKRVVLQDLGLDDNAPRADEQDDQALVGWYFAARGVAAPADVSRYWRELDFPDEADFLRAVRREHRFVHNEKHQYGEGSA